MCFKKLFRKKEKIAVSGPEQETAPAEAPLEPGKIELEPEAEKESIAAIDEDDTE